MRNLPQNTAAKRILLLNRYYKITHFYDFIRNTAIKGGIILSIALIVIFALDYYLFDFKSIFNYIVDTYSALTIYTIFLLSETFMGLIPPEIFIAWCSRASHPWLFLAILASLSYLGGIISYAIGNRLFLIKPIQQYIEGKIQNHIENIKKWGGLFIFLGAVSPVPHSMVSLAAGLINYSKKQYLLWALFRYLRFAIYALAIFNMI